MFGSTINNLLLTLDLEFNSNERLLIFTTFFRNPVNEILLTKNQRFVNSRTNLYPPSLTAFYIRINKHNGVFELFEYWKSINESCNGVLLNMIYRQIRSIMLFFLLNNQNTCFWFWMFQTLCLLFHLWCYRWLVNWECRQELWSLTIWPFSIP